MAHEENSELNWWIFIIYSKCLDPDPYCENGSGLTKLLNTDPIWIGIHNTDNQNAV